MENTYTRCRYRLNTPKLLMDREMGFKRHMGYDDDISKKVYTNMCNIPRELSMGAHQTQEGGIFNLEFNLDG